MSQPKLTVKQRKFVAAYNGNGADAARKAGYSEATAKQIAYENFTKPYLKNEIVNRLAKQEAKLILNRIQRQELWTQIAVDSAADISARLRASELLGKSEGDFIDRVQVEQSLDLTIALKKAEQRILSINTNDLTHLQINKTEPSSEIADGALPAPPDHDIFS